MRSALVALGCLLLLASGCSRNVYTALDIVLDVDGQRYEIANFARCYIFDRQWGILTVRRLSVQPDGSLPALQLPSGAGIVVALPNLDPCYRQSESLLTAHAVVTREPPLPQSSTGGTLFEAGSLLREGEIVSLDLRPFFTSRKLENFVAWLDDVGDPTEVLGYTGDRLFDDPSSKVRIVSATIRRMSPREWENREPTRIEDIIPWIAKYCPEAEKKRLYTRDHHWQWLAPTVMPIPLADLPDGALKDELASRSDGLFPLPYETAKANPYLRAFDGPAYSMTADIDDHFRLNTDAMPPADILLFHLMNEYSYQSSQYPISIDRIDLRDHGKLPSFYYLSSAKTLLRLSTSSRFDPGLCSSHLGATKF